MTKERGLQWWERESFAMTKERGLQWRESLAMTGKGATEGGKI